MSGPKRLNLDCWIVLFLVAFILSLTAPQFLWMRNVLCQSKCYYVISLSVSFVFHTVGSHCFVKNNIQNIGKRKWESPLWVTLFIRYVFTLLYHYHDQSEWGIISWVTAGFIDREHIWPISCKSFFTMICHIVKKLFKKITY